MKKKLIALIFVLMAMPLVHAQKSEITVKGSVKFPDDKSKIRIFYADKFDEVVIDSFEVKADHTFEKKVTLPFPGIYYIDCQKWEYLEFWGEDENIEVHFRGQDTAKIKIKNPLYEHIVNPGRNNELMNLQNYFDHMAYQGMISAGKEVYQAGKSTCDEWKEYVKKAYDRNAETSEEYIKYLVRYYGDRNSAISLLYRLKDEELKNSILTYFQKNKPDYIPYVKYVKEEEERLSQSAKLEAGKIAPGFSFPTPDGKKTLGPENFKGKYLLIDFWASWCGPCRKAIPHLKEAYAKYKAQGFEILSVSIDRKETDWKKALNEEKMPWSQTCAPNSGKDIMSTYQFSGIPHLVLLDKDGKIIERGIVATELDETLAKIIAE